jgi:DNA repair protein RecN (Recombination protein N)
VQPDELADLHEKFAAQLAALDQQGGGLAKLREVEAKAREEYIAAAESLSKARNRAIKMLEAQINRELPPLKLERAKFSVQVEKLDEPRWGERGWDSVVFAGADPGAVQGPAGRNADLR